MCDRVAGEQSYVAAPGFGRGGPRVVVLVDLCGSDHDDVDVAVDVGFPSGERSEDDHAQGWVGERTGQSTHLVEHGVGGASEGQQRPGSDVFRNEPKQGGGWNLPPLHDAERDQVRQQPGCLGLAGPGELGDGPQVQLSSGLGQDGEHAALGAWHDGLDGSDEVHDARLLTSQQKWNNPSIYARYRLTRVKPDDRRGPEKTSTSSTRAQEQEPQGPALLAISENRVSGSTKTGFSGGGVPRRVRLVAPPVGVGGSGGEGLVLA